MVAEGIVATLVAVCFVEEDREVLSMTQIRLRHVLTAMLLLAPGAVSRTSGATVDAPSAVIRDGFETSRTLWNQEQTDATINLLAHDRTSRAAH